MNKFEFYVRWLVVVSFMMIGGGLALALFKNTLLLQLVNVFINPYFWPSTPIDKGSLRFEKFSFSLLGALMATWGVLLLGIAKYAFKEKTRWAWNYILFATCIWFAIDESFSIYYGVWINALGNIPFFFMLIIPLICTRKYMVKLHPKEKT